MSDSLYNAAISDMDVYYNVLDSYYFPEELTEAEDEAAEISPSKETEK